MKNFLSPQMMALLRASAGALAQAAIPAGAFAVRANAYRQKRRFRRPQGYRAPYASPAHALRAVRRLVRWQASGRGGKAPRHIAANALQAAREIGEAQA